MVRDLIGWEWEDIRFHLDDEFRSKTGVFEMNPKNWHIELREDTGIQGILIEDDIFASNEQDAIAYLIAWKHAYGAWQLPKRGIIAVCTSNWTDECIYQDVSQGERNEQENHPRQ